MRYKLILLNELDGEKITITTCAEDLFEALSILDRSERMSEYRKHTKLIMAFPEELITDYIANASVKLYKAHKEVENEGE